MYRVGKHKNNWAKQGIHPPIMASIMFDFQDPWDSATNPFGEVEQELQVQGHPRAPMRQVKLQLWIQP